MKTRVRSSSNHQIDVTLYRDSEADPNPVSGSGMGEVKIESPLQLDASASQAPTASSVLTYGWDIDGDGNYGDAVGETPEVSWPTLVSLGIECSQEYTVQVRVEDTEGNIGISPATTFRVIVPGDMDFDGDLDLDDVGPFVLGLTDEVGYEATYGEASSLHGDIDGDGDLDLDDVDPFVTFLTQGSGPSCDNPGGAGGGGGGKSEPPAVSAGKESFGDPAPSGPMSESVGWTRVIDVTPARADLLWYGRVRDELTSVWADDLDWIRPTAK